MKASQLRKFRERVQKTLEDLFPASVQIGSSVEILEAATGGVTRGGGYAPGGRYFDDDIAFRVRKDLLPRLPSVGVLIRWVEQDLVFKIDSVTDAGTTEPAWRIGAISLEGE